MSPPESLPRLQGTPTYPIHLLMLGTRRAQLRTFLCAGLFERRTAHKATTVLLPEPPEGQHDNQVVVSGYEYDRTSLEHLMESFGMVVRCTPSPTRFLPPPLLLPACRTLGQCPELHQTVAFACVSDDDELHCLPCALEPPSLLPSRLPDLRICKCRSA